MCTQLITDIFISGQLRIHNLGTLKSSLTRQKIKEKQVIASSLPSGLRTPPTTLKEKEEKPGRTGAADCDRPQILGFDEADLDILSPHYIHKQLIKLMAREEYANVTVTSIGRSAAYNDVVLLKAADTARKSFRSQPNDDNKNIYAVDVPEKKIIFIVHGLTLMGFKDVPCLIRLQKFVQLVKTYFKHLNKFDIFVIPMANPDGVAHSYQVPLWNKNLSPQDACPGVALDRNFEIVWNGRANVKSCSQQFPGDRPFTEPETVAIRDVFRQYGHKIIAYIHVHAGGYHEHIYKGDAILYPKGYTDEQIDDDRYVDMKGEVDDMMKNASFKLMSLTMTTLHEWYGKVTGTSVDYASTVYGIPFALEFVMQIYDSREDMSDAVDNLSNAAQYEIWHRTINVLFKYISKISRKMSENARRGNTALPPLI